ncbi:hypothetical protein HMPREF0201_01865 [Cedecea davisae DSM 4568]|uniref:Uncharacterized protein n=1 Tax=Cedecea davisae DSM 4568 TaxID=566551 RepID=S3IZE9_9ENTR|nr:hypothetical protein HMPREF0201_01865 [Cedecea davisae DSM 4568]
MVQGMAAGSHGVLQLPGLRALAVEAIDEGIRLLAAAIQDYIAAGEKR